MASEKKGTVLLLKAPKDNEEDRFVETLEQARYLTVSVPVLAFKFINQDQLEEALRTAKTFSGIILTSPRSVQAVDNAIATVRRYDNTQFNPSNLRCFVVGQATADAARHAGFNPEGTHTGNAEKLSQFILDSVSPQENRPLLFPCAQMRRDTLKEHLQNTAFGIHEITAYETCPSQTIQDDIASAFQSENPPDSVVFFSPSGVQFTADIVQHGVLPIEKVKVFALGPSTEQEIIRRGYKLTGVAIKPDPVSLLNALEQAITDAERVGDA